MSTSDLAVDGAGVGSVLLALGTVDKGNTLAKVPLGLGSTVHALQLDDGSLGGLEVLATLVAEMTGLDVKTKARTEDEIEGWIIGLKYRILFSEGISGLKVLPQPPGRNGR